MTTAQANISTLPKRVLIAEDDRDFALISKLFLEKNGYIAEIATSISGALQLQQRALFPVALVDIFLGREDGFNLISQLTANYPEILCIVITAHPQKSLAVKALEHGAHDILFKPCDPPVLLASLNRCFERLQLSRINSLLTKGFQNMHTDLQSQLANLANLSSLDKTPNAQEKHRALHEVGQILEQARNERLGAFCEKIGLTKREQEILRVIRDNSGNSYRIYDLAIKLSISHHTLRTHLRTIYGKLNVNSMPEMLQLLHKI